MLSTFLFETEHMSDIIDIRDMAEEIIQGITAYENAVTVVNYTNKYGYTEHFKLLIGEEGLIQQAKEAVGKFFRWLKEKIVTFISKLFRVLRDLKASIKRHFAPGQDQPMRWKYDIHEVESAWTDVIIKLNHLSVKLNDDTDFSKIADINQQLVDAFNEGLKENKDGIVYRRRDIYKHANTIGAGLNQMSGSVGLYVKALEKFQKQIDTTVDMETLVEDINIVLHRYNNVFVDADIDKEAQPTNIVKGFVRLLTIAISAIDTAVDLGTKYINELHRVYTKDGYSINMTFPMDQDFVRRLGEHYGATFRIRNMVVTNTNPNTWPNPIDDQPNPTMGWCAMGQMSNTVDFYINVRVIISWFDRIFNAAGAIGTASKVNQFIFLIVHECQHLYDSQVGRIIDTTKDYDEQDHERDANESARTFQITEKDRAWVKSVIQKVTAEYRRQKQNG